ncbi:DODA-type extradiol aromatic ring-opening family dioxygenase [Aquirhabdus sp.]|uniref:DODA-type extradiol aromatic ring-opening family dioxygenase n=1 Tax=Aquirhabdus sp. TaxID=2824160 RepID=UPI00396C40B6
MTYATLPALFISHGSPMMAVDAGQASDAMFRLSNNLPQPNAIVVVSAHWLSDTLEISTAMRPETWHDFSGFPPELYQIRYPAAGSPALAERIIHILDLAGITAHGNALRPRDHGVWAPLRHLYPDANIPVVQISIPTHYSPAQLRDLGRALISLRGQQILLIGSGSITHNLRALSFRDPHAMPEDWAKNFKNWMIQKLGSHSYDEVLNWRNEAPYAKQNHPTDEHLLPLFFTMGAGERFNVVHSSFSMGSLGMDIYRFD